MDWLNKAAELNSNGASLLNVQSTKLALEYFKGSLEILSALAAGFEQGEAVLPSSESALPTSVASERKLPVGFPSIASSATTLAEGSPGPSRELEDTNHYVFQRGLAFAPIKDLCPELLSFYVAVVEFNMALSLQLLSPRWGEHLLFDSIHVYDCCLDHLHHSGCNMESCNTLFFAALNNKAAILYGLSNFDMAKDVLGRLLDAINSCRKTGGLTNIEDNDLEGFLFNVMLFKGACVAPAA